MSWGFFVELECSLPATEWESLAKKRPGKVAADWSGFEATDLQKAFAPAKRKGTFGDLLNADDVRAKVTTRKAKVTVRVLAHLDRSELELAAALASLLDGVAEAGGKGELALVNDGTYSGEDGVLITRASGRKGAKPSKPKPLENYDERLEALTMEFAGEHEGARDALEEPATRKPRLTLAIVERDAFEAFKVGNEAHARTLIEELIDQGGSPTPYLARMYAILLRGVMATAPPAEREKALDRLFAICARQRELRIDSPALVEIVAVGNENGRSDATIDLVLQGLAEGLQPESWLIVNTTNSGCRSTSAALRMRLAAAFLPLLVEGSPQLAQPSARISIAELLRFKGDREGAFAALEAAVKFERSLKENLRADAAEWTGYNDDPRWKKLVR